MKITLVSNAETDERIYRVQDDDSLQGMYFLSVNQEDRELTLSSIDLDGNPDEADLLLIAARLPLDEPKAEDPGIGTYTWGYIDDVDLAKKLIAITGEQAAVITQDLGIAADIAGDDWAAAISTGDENPVTSRPPAMAKVTDFEFEFDAEELSSGGSEGGGEPSDLDFAEPDPSAGPEDDPEADPEDAKKA
jgi:hypothetical protein